MMTAPSLATGVQPEYEISSNEKKLAIGQGAFSIEIWTSVNKIPRAKLVLNDGSSAARDFPISNDAAFAPGAKIELSLGYDGKKASVFKGTVCRHGIEIPQTGGSRLIVEAVDKAAVMTLARNCAVYKGCTDSKLMETLIVNAGLSAEVESTTVEHAVVVQHYCSDWDLMVMRAELNGMLVTVEAGKVIVKAPKTSAKPSLNLVFGTTILDFHAEMNAETQYAASAFQGSAWNPEEQSVATSGEASASVTEAGNLSAEELAKVFDVTSFSLQTDGILTKDALTDWAKAALVKSRLAKIRGQVSFRGSTQAKLGDMISLEGVGARFRGNVFISGVHHSMCRGLWRTTLEFGLSPQWFAETASRIVAPGASGLMPAAKGLLCGTVQKMAVDSDGEFRVCVQLPLLRAEDGAEVWARLGSPYASAGNGMEFYPEVGDEVVLAFLGNDPRFPVILGSLYSKKRAAPNIPEEKNLLKSIVTKSGLRLDFFEDKKAVEIKTPGGQSVRLDDEAKTTTIKDLSGNSATFSSGGITLDCADMLTLKAKKDIELSADGNISLKAKGNVTVDGNQINQTAKMALNAESNGQAKLNATGTLTIQGMMVNIN